MHAIRLHEFGPAENLRYEEVPDLAPSAGQVRIAVEAAGVHLIDTVLRGGAAAGTLSVSDLPMTPGREVAGTVDKIGPGVEGGWPGRRVVAHLGAASGGYAEQAVAASLRCTRSQIT
jgi:NADPH2:quinone reductase